MAKKVHGDDYITRVGTVLYSDDEITIVHYEYDGIVEDIIWPTDSLEYAVGEDQN